MRTTSYLIVIALTLLSCVFALGELKKLTIGNAEKTAQEIRRAGK